MGHYAGEMSSGDSNVIEYGPFIEMQCRTDSCPDNGKIWEFHARHLTLNIPHHGLMQLPKVLCMGCMIEPQIIRLVKPGEVV